MWGWDAHIVKPLENRGLLGSLFRQGRRPRRAEILERIPSAGVSPRRYRHLPAALLIILLPVAAQEVIQDPAGDMILVAAGTFFMPE